MKNISNGVRGLSVILFVVALLAVSSVAKPVFAQEFDGGFGDGGCGCDYGTTDIYPSDYGTSDIYPSDYGTSDIYPSDYGTSDIYPTDYGTSDIYPNDYGTSDIYPSDYGTSDIYPSGTDVTYENGLAYSYTPTFSAPSSFGSTSYYSAPSFSYPSTPVVFNAPSYRPIVTPAPVITPAPKQNTVVSTTPTNVTNVNNNTNNNNNNINISNNVPVVTQVQAAPVQPVIQYVQQPTYVQPIVQPSCTITITNYNGGAYGPYATNQLATLSWTSSNATSAYISPNVGTVSGYGSMQVYPVNGQPYTMTVYGQSGTATCVTQIFNAPIVQNPTPYVSLSQIPYTGFDFGTLGNAIYWLSLMVFAGAAAYLVLYFNGGALAVLGMNRSKRYQAEMPKITVSHAPAVVATKVEAPVVSPIQLATSHSTSHSKNTSDQMHVTHSKAGEMPRIHISRA